MSEYTCARSQITNLHPIIVLTRRQYTLTHTHTGSRSVDSHSRLVIFIIIIIIIIAQSFDLVSYAQSAKRVDIIPVYTESIRVSCPHPLAQTDAFFVPSVDEQ